VTAGNRFEQLLGVYDHLPPAQAVAVAWRRPIAPTKVVGTWHTRARLEVSYLMPLLTRALDRLLEDLADELPGTDWRLWE
jgi:hypothetical protein